MLCTPNMLLTSTEFFLPSQNSKYVGQAPNPTKNERRNMRKRRIKKNFWLDEEENNTLKNLSSMSGKSEVQVVRKLIKGATIKEKPPQDFYVMIQELVDFRKEIKTLKDIKDFIGNVDMKRIDKTLNEIDELRFKINEKYLK